MNNFENDIINKIDNNEELTENELSQAVFKFGIANDYGENRRWTRIVTTIIKLFNRTFSVDWEEGLTENQDDGFYNQPYEVELKIYDKVIKVEEWIPIN